MNSSPNKNGEPDCVESGPLLVEVCFSLQYRRLRSRNFCEKESNRALSQRQQVTGSNSSSNQAGGVGVCDISTYEGARARTSRSKHEKEASNHDPGIEKSCDEWAISFFTFLQLQPFLACQLEV